MIHQSFILIVYVKFIVLFKTIGFSATIIFSRIYIIFKQKFLCIFHLGAQSSHQHFISLNVWVYFFALITLKLNLLLMCRYLSFLLKYFWSIFTIILFPLWIRLYRIFCFLLWFLHLKSNYIFYNYVCIE